MVGVEFQDADFAKAVQNACLAQRLLLLTCGTFGNVIRWIPPLVVTAEQIQEALAIFEQALVQAAVTG
jgi:4-aminobutyrate aminotransferase